MEGEGKESNPPSYEVKRSDPDIQGETRQRERKLELGGQFQVCNRSQAPIRKGSMERANCQDARKEKQHSKHERLVSKQQANKYYLLLV